MLINKIVFISSYKPEGKEINLQNKLTYSRLLEDVLFK